MEVRLEIENKFNEGFLRRVFGANKTEPIKVTRDTGVGKMLFAMVKYSDTPVKQTIGLQLIMPNPPEFTGKNKFLYYTIEDQLKINDYISASFKIWMDRILLEGIYKLNLQRNDIVDIIISELKMENNAQNEQRIYERIKKYDYRSRVNARKNLVKAMENFEY